MAAELKQPKNPVGHSGGWSKIFSRQYVQIIYGPVLIILIPLTVILNTVYFVNNFSANLDIQLQRQALLLGEVFNATVKDRVENPTALQIAIEEAALNSPEIKNLDILYPEGEDFKLAASLDKTSIGQISSQVSNVIAWHEGQAIAKLTNSDAPSIVGQDVASNHRYWSVVMPLYNEAKAKVGLLHLKMSLDVMDRLAAQTLFRSYILLTITLIIVILLLILNTRMFEYAHLFKKLKEVDQMKDEFISIASHELRTPITALKGYVDMFLTGDFGPVNEQGSKGLKIMEGSIGRLGNLVEDLLNVSRIEQKRLELTMVQLNVKEVLSLLVDELRHSAEIKGLKLQLSLGETSPIIMADQDKFRQVFINIIGNAIKYSKAGSVNISVKQLDNKVAIKVKDTGIGMSAKDREHLFEKFYRVKSEQTKGIVGTGLGLWITKQLVEMMRGEITVDSIEGVGTEFTVIFPSVK